jgi:uncharacterized integral membrane protein
MKKTSVVELCLSIATVPAVILAHEFGHAHFMLWLMLISIGVCFVEACFFNRLRWLLGVFIPLGVIAVYSVMLAAGNPVIALRVNQDFKILTLISVSIPLMVLASKKYSEILNSDKLFNLVVR